MNLQDSEQEGLNMVCENQLLADVCLKHRENHAHWIWLKLFPLENKKKRRRCFCISSVDGKDYTG